MTHLRVFLTLVALVFGVLITAIFTANAGAPVGQNALLPRAYLPLVARNEPTPHGIHTPTPTPTPGPGSWHILLEEGFEVPPEPLWSFRDDNGMDHGAYRWGRRDCQPFAGSYSAWAVGGGADGEMLSCGSAYPDNVATTMIYGPFSLADAKMAQMRFKLRYDQVSSRDDFCWLAADAPLLSDATVVGGLCLNAQPTDLDDINLDLGDLDAFDPGVSLLGEPQVWVAFRFISDATGQASPGPFVDDVVIRKCLDTMCRFDAPAHLR